MGAIRRAGSTYHAKLLCDVVQAAQGRGGLPTVGYTLAVAGNLVWAVALAYGTAPLLNPLPVVL